MIKLFNKVIFIITFLFVFICSFVCEASLVVKMLNVGQGDAILIQTDNKTFLIDTSDVDERRKLIDELTKANVSVIDAVILTHPHSDHIGGLNKLLNHNKFNIKHVYENSLVSPSRVYIAYHKSLDYYEIPCEVLCEGKELVLDSEVSLKFMNPPDVLDDFSYNDSSLVCMLNYHDFSMLFTGDMTSVVEERLIDIYDLSCDILKVGHHGSKTSTSDRFLDKVSPRFALISAGEPGRKWANIYGHPHQAVLDRLSERGITWLWTWQTGTITIVTDGLEYSVYTESGVEFLNETCNR